MKWYRSILSLFAMLSGEFSILYLFLALPSLFQSVLKLFELFETIIIDLLLLFLKCCVLGDRIELADNRLVKQVQGTVCVFSSASLIKVTLIFKLLVVSLMHFSVF